MYSYFTWGLFLEAKKVRLDQNRPHVFIYFDGDLSVKPLDSGGNVFNPNETTWKDLFEKSHFEIKAKFFLENMSRYPAFNLTSYFIFASEDRLEVNPPDSINYNIIRPSNRDSIEVIFNYRGGGFDQLKKVHLFTFYEFSEQMYYNYSTYRFIPIIPTQIDLEPAPGGGFAVKPDTVGFWMEMSYQENDRFK